jgi:hypothetical protein
MKKNLLMLALFGCLAFNAFAQKNDGGKFSFGLEGGAPLGNTKLVSNLIFGASLKYEQPIAGKISLTISGGYTYISYSNDYKVNSIGFYGTTTAGEGYIPLKVGIKYFIKNGFYAEAQAGSAISTQSGGGAAFAYSPGIGVKFDKNFDFGIRFEGWTKSGNAINQAAARLAYSF